MILSFHPIIVGDENRLCAGRRPDGRDLSAIRAADAVILPQGCYPVLFEMVRQNCAHFFPDYTCRFDYPGKISQSELFRKLEIDHPDTQAFTSLETFYHRYDRRLDCARLQFPLVFKFDWGGEGHGVYRVDDPQQLLNLLDKAAESEKTGQSGFLLQRLIPDGGRALRVVVIGETILSYWRVQSDENQFCANLATGATIDSTGLPGLQQAGRKAARLLSGCTGINLAGIDFLFDTTVSQADSKSTPLILEINYFFGRRGIGDSNTYYTLLRSEIVKWLQSIHLPTETVAQASLE
ncbi:MAG: hypothetical protein JRH15_04930 [Deltaproteobacteria bacterium]|nr:hypothetical protein [Deltaproteobacteria bacterium]